MNVADRIRAMQWAFDSRDARRDSVSTLAIEAESKQAVIESLAAERDRLRDAIENLRMHRDAPAVIDVTLSIADGKETP